MILKLFRWEGRKKILAGLGMTKDAQVELEGCFYESTC